MVIALGLEGLFNKFTDRSAPPPKPYSYEPAPQLRRASSLMHIRQRKASQVHSACKCFSKWPKSPNANIVNYIGIAVTKLASAIVTAPNHGAPGTQTSELSTGGRTPRKLDAQWLQLVASQDATSKDTAVAQYGKWLNRPNKRTHPLIEILSIPGQQYSSMPTGLGTTHEPLPSNVHTRAAPIHTSITYDSSALDRNLPATSAQGQRYSRSSLRVGVTNQPAPSNTRGDRPLSFPAHIPASYDFSNLDHKPPAPAAAEVSQRITMFCDSPGSMSIIKDTWASPNIRVNTDQRYATTSSAQSPDLDGILSEFERYNREHMHDLPTLDYGSSTESDSPNGTLDSHMYNEHYVLKSGEKEPIFQDRPQYPDRSIRWA
jgi:hypothetical protein